MADEIKVGVVTDISALKAGLAEAQAQVKAAASNMADAEAAFGRAAEQGSDQAKAALGEYTAALDAAEGNLAALIAAQDGVTASAGAEAAALRATDAAARASASGGAMAMNAAFRTMQGSMFGADRAASAFAATTLGLGPVLQKAFPLIGAAALVDILFSVGEKLYDVYEKATQAGQEISRAFGEANEKIQAGNDSLELSNSRLQDEINKLEGHPGNGLQTALLESITMADRLQAALAADNRELKALLKDNEVTPWAGLFSGTVSTTGLDKDILKRSQETETHAQQLTNEFRESQKQAASSGDKAKGAEAIKQYLDGINKLYDDESAALKPKLDHFYELQKENNDKIAEMHKLHIPTGYFTSQDVDYSPAVDALEGQQAQIQAAKQRAADIAAAEPLKAKVGTDEQAKEAASAANTAREKQLHDLEQSFSEEEALYGKNANMAAAYWDQYLNTFRQGTTQFEAVLNKVNTAREELGKKEPSTDLFGKWKEEQKKLDTESAESSRKYQEHLDGMSEAERRWQDEISTSMRKAEALAAERSHDQTLGGLQVKVAQVQSADYTGINPKVELEAMEKLHQQEIAEDERYIQQEMAIYAKEPEKLQQLQKQLDEVHTRGLVQQVRDTANALQQEEAIYKRAYSVMTQDFNQTINKFITSTEKPAQAFAQMFDKILEQLANFVEQWLEKKAEMWLLDEVFGKAAQTTAAAATIASDAAVAAAGAYAATAAIPLVGPELAPAAAATAYAATMSFVGLAAFDQGGVVGGMGGMPVPIMAHAGERVLSAPQTQNFERMVNQTGGGGGHSTHLHYNGQVNAFDKNGMRETLRTHAEDILQIVREGLNTGKLRK
jgi:hypothetical protein